MGYCMNTTSVRFRIPAAMVPAAKQSITNLGGIAKEDQGLDPFKAVRWEAVYDAEGNIVKLRFTGEKYWNEDDIFAVLAPFVDDGCFIEMVGEDGDKWRWTFQNGTCTKVEPKVSW